MSDRRKLRHPTRQNFACDVIGNSCSRCDFPHDCLDLLRLNGSRFCDLKLWMRCLDHSLVSVDDFFEQLLSRSEPGVFNAHRSSLKPERRIMSRASSAMRTGLPISRT